MLTAELAALPDSVRLTTYDADDALLDLPISSKFNGEADFLSELFDAGRAAVMLQPLPGQPPVDTSRNRNDQRPEAVD